MLNPVLKILILETEKVVTIVNTVYRELGSKKQQGMLLKFSA